MKVYRMPIGILVLFALLILSPTGGVLAQHHHGRGGSHGPVGPAPGHGGFWAELTEEQREAIHEKMEELHSQEATHEEIHAAVQEMLEEWGIELPNHPRSNAGETTSSEEMSAASGVMSSEGISTDFILQAKSYPNPFNGEADIAYTLDASANV
jgi:hypothetical protein